MSDLADAIRTRAEQTGFSGVVSVAQHDQPVVREAFGMADRRCDVANTTQTRFATASATKGFTALAVMSLIDDGILSLDTTARRVLGSSLPLIDDAVTVEHLLAHRSGIGDYLDESVLTDDNAYVMPVPVHQLATTEDYLAVLDGYPQVFSPGTAFAYNNGAFVVLALVAERASGTPYVQLVEDRICRPAGMTATGFVRSDELGPGTAMGYLHNDGLRTNALHLPVVGTGDGGIYSTVDDISRLWAAFFGDRIVPPHVRELMTRTHSVDDQGRRQYGLGFWLHGPDSAVSLIGGDAGVSFSSVHDPATSAEFTVVSNTTDGAWPIVELLSDTPGPFRQS